MGVAGHESMPKKTKKKGKAATFERQRSLEKEKETEKSDNAVGCEHAVQKDVFLEKIHARPINGQFLLDHKLGEGGFGKVFLGRDITDGKEVALKLEHRSIVPSILEEEAEKCKQFQGLEGFPEIYWYGWHDDYKVMAFELLGPSLEDLFVFCGHHFSFKTGFMLMDQLLQRLECLHSKGVLHRDIKPQNCLMGTGLNGNVVYITDFGLAEDADLRDDLPVTSPVTARLIGTARFASIRGHEGRTQSFKDDLESLGYNLIYFVKGKLPWQGLDGRRKEKELRVMEKKKSTGIDDLCAGLPEEFAEYMRYVRELEHAQFPDYAKLRAIFHRREEEEDWEHDNVFDWTILLFLQHEHANELEGSPQR